MPVIHVHMLGGATREQKAQIVREMTESMARIMGSNPEKTHVILDEKSPEDWGSAGELIADRRAKQQA